MSELSLHLPTHREPHVVCIGAHCDDIEIGCAGTILKLAQARPHARFTWMVLTGDKARHRETKQSAGQLFDNNTAIELQLHDFRDGHLPYTGSPVKDAFERLKGDTEPDLIFTHWEHDRHQDHRFVSELTWSTFRRHLILEYEIPKYDGDIGTPNMFVALSEAELNHKLSHIMRNYSSQVGKPWFTQETFAALHRLRGIECTSQSQYAEAFYCRKSTLIF